MVIGPVRVQGLRWSWEATVIAALVRRLGGKVELTADELVPRGGLMLMPKDGGGLQVEVGDGQ